MATHLELCLPAQPASVREAREVVGGIATRLGASPPAVYDIRLAVSEAAANVVQHAFGPGEDGDYAVTVDQEGEELIVIVRDEGVGMAAFRSDGDLGYGLRIVDQLAVRSSISSAPNVGTVVEMVFDLSTRTSALRM